MILEGTKEYSIDSIIDNHIIFTKDGAVSYLYELDNPIKHTLSEKDFDTRINKLVQALKGAPSDSYAHKQDIYLRKHFDSSAIQRSSFLGESMKQHFHNKLYTDHTSTLILTLNGLQTLKKAYQLNPLTYSKELHEKDRHKLNAFIDFNNTARNVFNSITNTSIKPLERTNKYIFDYINGFADNGGVYDLDYKVNQFGKNYFSVFSFNKAEFFHDEISNVADSETGFGEQILKEGTIDFLGEEFAFNHIVNQLIFFCEPKKLLKEIEDSKKEYSRFRTLNPHMAQRTEQLEDQYKHLSEDGNTVVKFHMNVILFAETKEELEASELSLQSKLNARDINFYRPRQAPLVNCFRSNIPGREKLLHPDFYFICNLQLATSLFTHTTLSKDDDEGVYFNDRIDQRLLRRDIWDEKNKRMNARNGITIANTGGGKSVSALRKITQYIEQGVTTIVVEFGSSFEFITKLYKDISLHIKYDPDLPLGFNPFAVEGTCSYEKKSYVVSILFKCWRVKEYQNDTAIGVSMNKIVQNYYTNVGENHSFESIYNYILNGGEQLLERLDILPKYFPLDSFKHICSEFLDGGKYQNVFKVVENKLDISQYQLVVFELDKIKKDPFLVTLILLVIQDAIDTNILAHKDKKGILIFDEFAETQAIRDIYTDEGVLETVAILFQKIRKENGAVHLILQDIAQLPDNIYTQGIIANTQILEVLASVLSSYKKIKKIFSLSDSAFELMCSIENNFSGSRPYSEEFLRLGERHFEVVKIELSNYEYLAFQTQGTVWKALQDSYSQTNDFEQSIIEYKTA